MAMRMTKVAQAYERSKVAREALFDANCRAMECTEDKCGIVWERFVTPAGVSLILFATPSWWDVYAPLSPSNLTDETVAAIKSKAAEPRAEAA